MCQSVTYNPVTSLSESNDGTVPESLLDPKLITSSKRALAISFGIVPESWFIERSLTCLLVAGITSIILVLNLQAS